MDNVDVYTELVKSKISAEYGGITHEAAAELLEQEFFDKMMLDPIKRMGPTKDTVFWWNLRDYLLLKELQNEIHRNA